MKYSLQCVDAQKGIGSLPDESIDLIFLDPPFNQGKKYDSHTDTMMNNEYWNWMKEILWVAHDKTVEGGAIYFMQREKNVHDVMKHMRESGWTFQNLIIWKKMTSAVPSNIRYGKQYQIIVYSTKGSKPNTFNKIRIDPPQPSNHKKKRKNGIYITDVWEDIRELTSGYFAGSEPLRDENNTRLHKQQTPIALLLRIILSSSNIGDMILDPFAGTGTTGIVAKQLNRSSIQFDNSKRNIQLIIDRHKLERDVDNVECYRNDYLCTDGLNKIWKCK